MNKEFDCIKCKLHLSHKPSFPLYCRCGLKYTSQTEYEQLPKMTLEIAKQMQEKLGLTPFGVPQPGIPHFLPKPPKPTDIPKEIEEWLNQYEQDENK